MSAVKIVHFSDILCIWAQLGQASLYRLVDSFGDRIDVEVHHCSVFPDSHAKIATMWRDRGGFDGYANHVREVAARDDTLTLHPDVWSTVRPRSSASAHLFLKAVDLLEPETAFGFAQRPSVRAAKALRTAFFTEGQDISTWSAQRAVCETIDINFDAVQARLETGEAIAKLAADYDLARSQHVQGSPTYILNEGRQKLFGDINYSILEANVNELISDGPGEKASLCA